MDASSIDYIASCKATNCKATSYKATNCKATSCKAILRGSGSEGWEGFGSAIIIAGRGSAAAWRDRDEGKESGPGWVGSGGQLTGRGEVHRGTLYFTARETVVEAIDWEC